MKINCFTAVGSLVVVAFATPVPARAAIAQLVTVAKSGGDYSDPVAAINSITNASAATPYLIKIQPGVYDLGSASVQGKPYVDIEGSGEGVTIITSTAGGYDFSGDCVLNLYGNSEIRSITVKATSNSPSGGDSYIGAAICINDSGQRLTHVTALAQQPQQHSGLMLVGIQVNANASAELRHVTATASSPGTNIALQTYNNANVLLADSTLTATGGSNRGIDANGSFFIMNSTVIAGAGSTSWATRFAAGARLLNSYFQADGSVPGSSSAAIISDTNLYLATSQVIGPLGYHNGGPLNYHCFSNSDSNMAPVDCSTAIWSAYW